MATVLNLLLFAAAFFGGALNSVAGGGSFLTAAGAAVRRDRARGGQCRIAQIVWRVGRSHTMPDCRPLRHTSRLFG